MISETLVEITLFMHGSFYFQSIMQGAYLPINIAPGRNKKPLNEVKGYRPGCWSML